MAGRLTVRDGTARLPSIAGGRKLQSVGPLKDVVFVDAAAARQAAAKRAAARGGGGLHAQLTARLPGPFHVRSKEVNADLKGDLTVEIVGPVTRISGAIESLGGWADLLGRRYQLERARLGFDGSPELDPALDIRATREVSDATIVIEVHGTARQPQLVFSSEPPIYDTSQVVAIVVSGDPGTERVSDRSLDQKVVGALSGAIVGKIKDQIAPQLPIDVLKVDVAGSDGFGLGQTRIELGKYVTESIYVSYVHQFGQPITGTRRINSNQAQIEYRFKRRYVVQTMFGDAGVGAIDFFWTLRY
jgi:translocation and assembly module TamB